MTAVTTPETLRMGEVRRRLRWSNGKLQRHLDADPPGVEIKGVWYPLRSIQESLGGGHRPGQRRVRVEDVAAVEEAQRAALQ